MCIQLFLHLNGSCLDHFWRNAKIWGDEKESVCTHVQKFPTATLRNHHETHSCNQTATNEDFPSSSVTGFYMKLRKLRREYGASGGDVIRSSIRKDILFSNTAHRSSQNNCMKRFQQTQSPSLPPWWNGLYVTALSVYPPSQRIWKGKGKKNVGDVRFSAVKQRVCPYLCRCTCRAAASWGEDRRRRRSG